jgi:hypothetical protein
MNAQKMAKKWLLMAGLFIWNITIIFLRICPKDFLMSWTTILAGASEVQIDFFINHSSTNTFVSKFKYFV